MKLISEFTENDIEFITEQDKKTGKKGYKIRGIFAQAEKKNRNGRIYPMPIIEKAVNKYDTEQVQRGRAGNHAVEAYGGRPPHLCGDHLHSRPGGAALLAIFRAQRVWLYVGGSSCVHLGWAERSCRARACAGCRGLGLTW